MNRAAGVLLLALSLAGCGDLLAPDCQEIGLTVTCSGTEPCPPPGSSVCFDGSVKINCTDAGGIRCRVR